MALTIGNATIFSQTPSGPTFTHSHTMDVGSDGFLMVSFAMSDSVSYSSCTYGGVAMTELFNFDETSSSLRIAVFGLLSPSTGANNVVATFSASQWNPVGMYAQSFLGSSGFGNYGNSTGTSSPNTKSLSISENSIIYGYGCGTNTISDVTINGSSESLIHDLNLNRWFTGAISPTITPAGSKNIVITSAANVSNHRVEIKELGVGGRRRIMVIS